MKKAVIYLLSFISTCCFAQQAELKQLYKGMDEILHQEQPFNLEYTIRIVGRENLAQEEKLHMHLFKNGQDQHMIMGDAQEIIQRGNMLLLVNHIQKTMVMQEDSLGLMAKTSILNDLFNLTDSAVSAKRTQKSGMIIFSLVFPQKFMYAKMSISFSAKSKQLASIYAEFSPEFKGPYHSMQIDYTQWNMSWKPERNFPNLEKFVVKKHERYEAQLAWKSYQYLQPERGKLKL